MTTCSDIREMLLEATPSELRGGGAGALAGHLRSCDACRRRAELLLRADDEMDAVLGVAEAPDVETILELASRPRVAVGWRARAGSGVRRFTSARRGWIPLAAAAAVAGLLLVARGGGPPALLPVAQAQALPTVEEASTGGVAIIETDNPDITVLWFFEQET